MKGMLIPIDIIWINDGKVSLINENVPQPATPDVPESNLPSYSPKDPIDYVLEVMAGFSKENKIKVGDAVDLSGI